MWVVIRPKPKMPQSVSFFNSQGIQTVGYSPIDIIGIPEALQQLQGELLHSKQRPLLVVTSTEAALRVSGMQFGRAQLCFCIGEATKALMAPAPLQCLSPELQTSEGLLALPELQHVENQQVLLIKGCGGRTLIADTLKARGAELTEFDVYQRQVLTPAVSSEPIDWQKANGILVTSQALLDATLNEVGIELLKNKVWVGVSQRICDYGRSLGIQEFYSSDGATDAHLLGWMQSNVEVGHDRT